MHDSTHEYDENCPGCQPAIMDLDGNVMPENHPLMVAVIKAFNKCSLTDRRAWHRVTLQNSRNPIDMEIAIRVSNEITQSVEGEWPTSAQTKSKKTYPIFEGEITQEFINDLLNKLKLILTDIQSTDKGPSFEPCKEHWIEIIKEAILRCSAIQIKLEHNIEHRVDDDRKTISISLCILDDFAKAKAINFEKQGN